MQPQMILQPPLVSSGPQPPESVQTQQILAEVSLADPKLQYSLEDLKMNLEPSIPLYLASSSPSARTLNEVLVEQQQKRGAIINNTENAGSSNQQAGCKMIHIKMNLPQNILLEQVAIYLKPDKPKKGGLVSIAGLQVQSHDETIDRTDFVLAPITSSSPLIILQSTQPNTSSLATEKFQNVIASEVPGPSWQPVPSLSSTTKSKVSEGVQESKEAIFINCAAFTNCIQLSLIIGKGKGNYASAGQATQGAPKELQSEDSEFDREVAMISLKTTPQGVIPQKQTSVPQESHGVAGTPPSTAGTVPEEKKEKSQAVVSQPVPVPQEKPTSIKRDFETLPRFYKATWSPDRPGYVPPPKKYVEETKETTATIGGGRIANPIAQPTASNPAVQNTSGSTSVGNKKDIQKSSELQLSPIQKESCLEPSRNDIVDYGLEDDDFISIVQALFSKLTLKGLPSLEIPPPSYAITLLNMHAFFERANRKEFLSDIDYMTALALFGGRRFLQASEILRKLESELLNKIESSGGDQCLSYPSPKGGSSNLIRSSYSRFPTKGTISGSGANTATNSSAQAIRLMNKASKLEVLIADGMNQHFQLSEKLNSLKRATDLFLGMRVSPSVMSAPSKFYGEDIYTSLIKLHPHLTRLLLILLTDQSECLKAATLRTLDFVLENMGCSLGNYVVHILKAIVSTYPNSSAPPFAHDSFNASLLSNTSGYPQAHSDPNKISPRIEAAIYGKDITKKKLSFEETTGSLPANYIPIIMDQSMQSSRKYLTMYNHLLETYVSVLSSISSQILHHIFTGVILSHSFAPEISLDLRAILLRIAEKIVTICQGDLILNPIFLTGIMNEQNSQNEQLASAAQTLWQALRAKIFPNCSPKSKKQIIDWLYEGLVGLAEAMAREDKNTGQNDEGGISAKAEEEIVYKLAKFIDVAIVLTADKPSQEEGNALVLRPKVEDRADMISLVNPLIYWLSFTMAAEGRMELFKQTWSCLSSILNSLRDLMDFDVNALLLPLLAKVNDHCKHSCPTLPMLQFLTIVLKGLKLHSDPEFNVNRDQETEIHTKEMQMFLTEFIQNLSSHIPSFPSEDIFGVFDTLLELALPYLIVDQIPFLVADLTDKFTLKSKKQKASLGNLIQGILKSSVTYIENNKQLLAKAILTEASSNVVTFFDVVLDYCMIQNKDVDFTALEILGKKDSKKPGNLHEKFMEKLNFLIDLLKSLSENHRSLYCKLIRYQNLGEFLKNLINNGHSSIRLRAHEIMEILCNYYIAHMQNVVANRQNHNSFLMRQQEESKKIREISAGSDLSSALTSNEMIRKDQLLLGKHILGVVKQSLEVTPDSYMQFNSLILLDLMFQSILPVPSFSAELEKNKSQKKSPEKGAKISGIIDLEQAEYDQLNVEYRSHDYKYLNMRMLAILKLWPYIQNSLNSPWSNIRSISYGLICSMLKVDIHDYKGSFKDKLKSIVLPLLLNLLGSKESESKAGGLNILGSLCGLSYDVTRQSNLGDSLIFFRRNSGFVSLAIWQQVFDLQEDWDSTIREAAIVLIQLSAPRDSVRHFHKVQVESKNLKMNFLATRLGNFCKIASSQIMQFGTSKKRPSEEISSLLETLDLVGRTTDITTTGMDEDIIRLECGAPGLNSKSNLSMLGSANNNTTNTKNTITANETSNLNNKIADSNNTSSFISSNEEPEEADEEYFFIDKYSDDQIKDIISIFRNDFKPPKNLWIEKNAGDSQEICDYDYDEMAVAAGVPSSSGTLPIGSKVLAGELPLSGTSGRPYQIVDILEDKLVDNIIPAVREKPIEKDKQNQVRQKAVGIIPASSISSGTNPIKNEQILQVAPKKPELAYGERFEPGEKQHKLTSEPEKKKNDPLDAEPYKFFTPDEDYNPDDLEIIDVEDEEFLGQLEGGEVPVLKNAYATKKSKRPPEARGKSGGKARVAPGIGGAESTAASNAPAVASVKIELVPPATSTEKPESTNNAKKDEIKDTSSSIESGKLKETSTKIFGEYFLGTAINAPKEEKKEQDDLEHKKLKIKGSGSDAITKKEITKEEVKEAIPHTDPKPSANTDTAAESNLIDEVKEDDLSASLRLKKNNNTMRPINGLRPITPPLPASQQPLLSTKQPQQQPEENPLKTKKEEAPQTSETITPSITAPAAPSTTTPSAQKKPPLPSPATSSSMPSSVSQSYRAHSKQLASSRTGYKKAPSTSPAKLNKSSVFPLSYNTTASTPKEQGGIKYGPSSKSNTTRNPEPTSTNIGSLPGTPTAYRASAIQKSPVVATLFKELTLNPKRKQKPKQKMQGHKELAQTSPALAAILKSLKEGNTGQKSSQQISGEGKILNAAASGGSSQEKGLRVVQSERAGKKIVIPAKKILGAKIIQTGFIEGKSGGSNLVGPPAKKGSAHHRTAKGSASSRSTKARIKSKSQVQVQGGPVQAINITTDQITLAVGELSGRDVTPLRNNYVQESNEGAEGEQDINQTY